MKITYMLGVEGNSLYINDFRVHGNKPWGGGRVISEWEITCKQDLKRILKEIQKELETNEKNT